MPWQPIRSFWGVPTAQSDPVSVANQQDWLNGVNLALEEINAPGGVNGQMIETKVVDIDILSPEGGRLRLGAESYHKGFRDAVS